MPDVKKPADTAPAVPEERSQFKNLLAKNPNYFGNLAGTIFQPIKKILTDTRYEELTCVGFNPATNFLEATIAIKLPTGYGGDVCQAGSTEYVRFFVDYGGGWEDAGLAGVKVHDIPTGKDCAAQLDKPLIYVVHRRLKPRPECCNHPVLPKVHAILSWQWMPPAGAANVGWSPVWGNALDCNIQLRPRPWNLLCLFDLINEGLPQKIKVPPLFEQVQDQPIPMPDPPPFTLAGLADMYQVKTAGRGAAAEQKFAVEPHRFGVNEIQAALAPGGFDQVLVASKTAEWNAIGLDWVGAVGALEKTQADVSYEQIECLGLDETFTERLVATFRIKRPSGYSGDLCHKGSIEYIAFWADWDNKCEWSYLGTAKVNVHDIAKIPKEGLCYSAILPVDLTYHRRSCDKPKIGRVRAVLSWAVPPSTTDPNALNYWGNRLDAHVQIEPGDTIHPGTPDAKIRNLGGIAIEDIDTALTGFTKPGDVRFANEPWATADGWGLGRTCPFGGIVQAEGVFYPGFYYRVKAHKLGDSYLVFTTLADSFLLERTDSGFDTQTAAGGFFKYQDSVLYFGRTLAVWSTAGDDEWDVQLDIATAPNEASIVTSSPWYRIQLDNTGPVGPPAVDPTMDIHIASGGDCKDVTQGAVIAGNFVADDLNFGAWALSTEPNTVSTPSNQPQPDPFLANTNAAPGPGGNGWKLDTANPVKMKPCGYVVRLDVSDRSILGSVPGQHNANHIEVGFCLREKK